MPAIATTPLRMPIRLANGPTRVAKHHNRTAKPPSHQPNIPAQSPKQLPAPSVGEEEGRGAHRFRANDRRFFFSPFFSPPPPDFDGF